MKNWLNFLYVTFNTFLIQNVIKNPFCNKQSTYFFYFLPCFSTFYILLKYDVNKLLLIGVKSQIYLIKN